MGKRNLVQKAIHDYRKWGETFRDRTKYHRGSPNKHELDEDIDEAFGFDPVDESLGWEDLRNVENLESDRHSEGE